MFNDQEINQIVHDLRCFALRDTATEAWWRQHAALAKLNLSSHLAAQTGGMDTVCDSIVTESKCNVIIRELIAASLIRSVLLEPLLPELDVSESATFLPHLACYSEGQLASLIASVSYTADFIADAGSDEVTELIDWASRRVAMWCTPGRWDIDILRPDTEALKTMTPAQLALQRRSQLDFACCNEALVILQSISEAAAAGRLSVSAEHALLQTHDLPLLLIRLLDERPWIMGRGAKRSVYEDGRWISYVGAATQTVRKPEGAVWLALISLLTSGSVMNQYEITPPRATALTGLKRHLTESVLRQIPPLAELRRISETASLGAAPIQVNRVARDQRVFTVEALPAISDELMAELGDAELARAELKHRLLDSRICMKVAHMLDFIDDDYVRAAGPPRCHCGRVATKRCSACHSVWYCSSECQRSDWPQHKVVCKQLRQRESSEPAASNLPLVAQSQKPLLPSRVLDTRSYSLLIDELDD